VGTPDDAVDIVENRAPALNYSGFKPYTPVLLASTQINAAPGMAGGSSEQQISTEVTSFGLFNIAGFLAPGRSLDDLSCYPNPFDPIHQNITVQYYLAQNSDVSLAIYDLLGNLVKTWEINSGDTNAQAGLNTLSWDGRNGQGNLVANGGYIVYVRADGQKKKFKVLVVK